MFNFIRLFSDFKLWPTIVSLHQTVVEEETMNTSYEILLGTVALVYEIWILFLIQ